MPLRLIFALPVSPSFSCRARSPSGLAAALMYLNPERVSFQQRLPSPLVWSDTVARMVSAR